MDDASQDFLKEYAASGSRSKYFKPPQGKPVIVTYLKYEMVPNYWDGGKTIVPRYHVLEADQLKYWDRPGKALAQIMSSIPLGTQISILMIGEKTEARYTVTPVEE